MCPMCWATALASFGGIFAISVLLVAGTDRWTLFLAGMLATASVASRWGVAEAPWWYYTILATSIAGRLTYLVVLRRQQLLVSKIWFRARQIAARRCPTQ